mmetsp:Transcript_74832/g.86880  ORF Transcript_74832/g.86880 Transcript_74832/m.86880 type:complete len:150 (+) Transcript_74832:27-476(+)
MSSKNPIFKEPFTVEEIDSKGKFFSKVSRIEAKNESFNLDLKIDINIDLYTMKKGQNYSVALATSLKKDGGEATGLYDAEELEKGNLIEEYDQADYVMFGKIYKIEEVKKDTMAVYASYGGLLMRLEGDAALLKVIPYDSRIYVLISKI